MVEYITKDEIADEVSKIITKSNYSWDDSPLPILAFDNDTWTERCDECKSGATHFKYNIAEAAGTDSVIFDWNVDLERLYLTGHLCGTCGVGEVYLHEETYENEGELIYEQNS